jgi:hypothetical protein
MRIDKANRELLADLEKWMSKRKLHPLNVIWLCRRMMPATRTSQPKRR